MKSIGKWILRYAPLIAALATGLQAIPELVNFTAWVLTFTGIFGIQPDPNFNSAEFGTQVALLVGSVRKLSSILVKYFRGL